MRYVAAYLLSGLGGKEHPTVEDIEAILASVGVECNKERVNQVVNELKGKKIDDIITEGKEKLAAFLTTPVHDNVEVAAATENSEEDTKEVQAEKKEETEESDDDLGFGLFD